jgi:hypothetical protein
MMVEYQGEKELLFHDYRVSGLWDKTVLEVDSDGGGIIK